VAGDTAGPALVIPYPFAFNFDVIMKPIYHLFSSTTLACLLPPFSQAQQQPKPLDPLIVEARGVSQPWSLNETIVSADHLHHADAAALVRKLPGAAVVRNGPQTGIVQLRGLSGDRVAVRVDGMTITPACPNHMDPPLHYAAASGGDLIDLYAGISPVSTGRRSHRRLAELRPAEPGFRGWSIPVPGKTRCLVLGSQDAAMATADLTFARGTPPSNTAAPAHG
jgi:iron complex outermembrane recepter protein